MSAIVILGAGDVGAETARRIAAADLASTVVIVDDRTTIAQGKALDIAQAGPVDRYRTAVVGTSDMSVVVGASVVVLADRADTPPSEWRDDAGLMLLKRIAGLNPTSPVICAGIHQSGLIEKGVGELGIARDRVLGTAAEALRAAIMSTVALEAGCAPADVSLTLVGHAPGPVIVPWDDAGIAGRPLTERLSVAQVARLEQRVNRLWPPGPFALASAAARVIRTMLGRLPYAHAAIVAVSREEGTPGRTAILPVTVGPRGLTRVLRPTLGARDNVRLENVHRA